jgi:hypothetical protein
MTIKTNLGLMSQSGRTTVANGHETREYTIVRPMGSFTLHVTGPTTQMNEFMTELCAALTNKEAELEAAMKTQLQVTVTARQAAAEMVIQRNKARVEVVEAIAAEVDRVPTIARGEIAKMIRSRSWP